MKINYDKWKIYLGILFISALLVRLFYIFFSCGFNAPLVGDAIEYNQTALNFLSGKGLQINNIWAFQPPLYSVFLASIYLFVGEQHNFVRFIQIILSSLSCVLIYLLALRIVNKKVALCAGIISVVYPGLISYAGQLLSETLFITLFLMSVLYIYNTKKIGKIINGVLAGFFLGLATLTRGVSLIFLPLVFLTWVIENQNIKKSLSNFLIILSVFVVTILPWTVRNYIRFNQFVLLDTHGGQVLADSNNPLSNGQWNPTWYKQNRPEFQKLGEVERNKAYYKSALSYIMNESPIRLLRLFFLKIMYFIYPFLPQYDIMFTLLFPFWLMGMYIALKQKSYILLAVVANFLIITIIFFGSPRIRDTVSPFIIILSSISIIQCFEKRRKIFFIAVVLWICINVAISFYAEPIRGFIKTFKNS